MGKPVSVAKKLTVNDMTPAPAGTPPENKPTKPKKSGRSGKALPIVLGTLLVLAIGFGGFMYWRYQDVSSDPASAISEKNQAETERVLANLKKVILVVETDAPTVARVEEPEKLKSSNQEFYKDVQRGDYLIIFPKRAIIFREAEGQIINVAPIINTAELQQKTNENKPSTTE